MKFALVNGNKTQATATKQRAVCPYPDCSAPMIAKVGEINVPHWAHQNEYLEVR